MPAGILQPGGPGTRIFVYDSTASLTGLDYTFAEVQTAFPNDFQSMVGAVSGLTWGGIRKQYLSNVPIRLGGQDSDGTAPTSIKDSNCDVYFRTGSLEYRTIGYTPALLRTMFGTRIASAIGSDERVGGKDGVDILTRTTQQFRGLILLYGSECFADGGNVQFIDSGASGFSEIAGCIFRTSSSYVIGNNVIPQMDVYNSTFEGTGVGNLVTGLAIRKSDNVVFSATGPQTFITSGSINLALSNAQFIGAPTLADLRWSGGGTNWRLYNPGFSETVGVPRFISTAGPPITNPTKELWYFNTKVVDIAGTPIMNVPVRMESDVDGPTPVDTKTFGDGDIGFVDPGTGIESAIVVRDHYADGSNQYQVRDRTYTIWVNAYGGAFPPLMGYETKRIVFQWPGRDVFQHAYQAGGGEFNVVSMPIMLLNGNPTSPALWDECHVA
jgi:hypothetical protein